MGFRSGLMALGMLFGLVVAAFSQDGFNGTQPKSSARSAAQESELEAPNVSSHGPSGSALDARTGLAGHVKDFLDDQRHIWTSPARTRFSDATWLVPLGGLAAGFFVTDRQFSASLSQNPATLRRYKTVSNVGVASLIGAGAGLYLFSFPAHNDHWRETGFLAGEAALNSLVTVEALKYSMGRDRPYQSNGSGSFFHGGTSFPSEHSAAAWSIAGVIAHEYPGTLPKLFAYGVASAVSFSRVEARQHFPSDVLIGSVLGYLISQNVYSRRHDPEIGGGAWESPHEIVNEDGMRTTHNMGTPYVPLDSWIYPALERLAALGYVKTASLGIRPWTRLECARLVNEAAGFSPDADSSSEAQELFQSLAREFSSEAELTGEERNLHVQLESVYQRSIGISGTPLTDGYHFGQTVMSDYGRPFQAGFNTVAGTSAWTTAGPFVIYVRSEYQYSPSDPAPSQAVLNFVSTVDLLPPNAPSTPIASISRFRALDAYVGMNFANWQMSFGKQSLWWGPSGGGTMAFSNNAEPITMFRLNRVSPLHAPWHLGDVRLDLFLGQLSGQQFLNNGTPGNLAQGQYGHSLNPQPFLSGSRISFKFTQDFEFSMSKTAIYGGPGNPLTWRTLIKSALSLPLTGTHLGDGRVVWDFSYRVPKLRNWMTLYGEGFSEDKLSPLYKPGTAVFQGGLYFPQLPRIPKLDLRLEGGSTSPSDFTTCNGCFYHNGQYVNGFTNNGQLMGTWIGRAAQGGLISSTYWLGPTRKIGIELRHRKIDSQFLPGGGTQNDVAVSADFLTKAGLRFSGMLQYEPWTIPLLAATRQSNVTASFELGFWPQVLRK